MGRYTLKDFSEEILNETKCPMTSIEIWEYGKEKGLDKKGGFIGKAPWTTILQKVSIDVQENPNSRFIIIDSARPKKISLKSLETSINNITEGLYKSEPKYKFDEAQLHPVLAYFVYTYLERMHTAPPI